MNIPIKTHSISSKTDQDTDQETWILISLHWILINEYLLFRSTLKFFNNTTHEIGNGANNNFINTDSVGY